MNRQIIANALILQFDKWIAEKQREDHGSNRSVLIDAINRYVSVPLGSPYCIASDLYAMHLVCDGSGLKNPIPREAGTQAFWFHDAPAKYKRPHGSLAQKGDVGIFQHTSNPDHGHGVLVRVDQTDPKLFQSDEGNTDATGGREGDGFYSRVRSTGTVGELKLLGFIDVCQWVADANA